MTLQEKIQKGLDCWCDRVHAETLDECKGLGCPYAGDDECSTSIFEDMDKLLKDGSKPAQTITPDMARRKVIEEIRDQCSTLWECEAYGDQLARDLAYIAGLVDMTNNVCKMLEGDGDESLERNRP